MGFISYCLSLSLYIMSSCLLRYSVLMNLILQMHAGQRSMCRVIVVDAESFRSTLHGHDAYIHDHCLRYRHNFVLFYQLLNSNLFTHHMLSSREKPLVKPMAPGSIFHHISFQSISLYLLALFLLCLYFLLCIYLSKIPKILSLSDLIDMQNKK